MLNGTFQNIPFKNLLLAVFNRILTNKYREELTNLLKEELAAGQDTCFVGKVSQIVNVLNGYDSHIVINISENEQINIVAYKVFQDSKTPEEYRRNSRKKCKREVIQITLIS